MKEQGIADMRNIYFDIDDRTKEVEALQAKKKKDLRAFQEKFEVSWIYHESALEGTVLDIFDLKAALDHATLEDGVLIPVYQRIRNHKNTIEKIKKNATANSRMPTLSFIKEVHQVLSYGLSELPGGQYRKDVPIHRSYYHEIMAPSRISYAMNKLVRYLKTKEFKQLHPLQQAAEVHFRLMHIFPFSRECGKLARLIMNFFVIRAGYLPIIIPAVERQHYYEALRVSPKVVHDLIVSCMEQTINLSLRFFDGGTKEIW
ncbi:MAG TPA: Fic family protein [Myxococcota bacterium]|nr:Fic family protein [Myxococcota bacterium]